MPAPSNDNFASRITIAGLGTTAFTTVDATWETGEPTWIFGSNVRTVWFGYTPPTSGWYQFKHDLDSFSGGRYPAGNVYTGATVSTLSSVGFTFHNVYANYYLTAGIEYKIQLQTYTAAAAGLAGNLTIGNSTLAINDDFANRTSLSGSAVAVTLSNELGTEEPLEENVAGDDYSTLWWEWTAPSTTNYYFNRYSYDYDELFVYTGGALGSLTQVTDVPVSLDKVLVPVTAATTYKIQARAPVSAAPSGYLRFWFWEYAAPPANDDIANAIELTGTSGSESGTLVGSTGETGEFAQRSVWYKLVAPSTGKFIITITGTGFNPLVEVDYATGVIPPVTNTTYGGTYVGDGTTTPDPYSGDVGINAPGEVLWIWVGNWEGDLSDGAFSFTWVYQEIVPPPYDDIVNALPWVQDNAAHTVDFATLDATDQGEGFDLGYEAGVWVKLQFPGWGPTDDVEGTVRVLAPPGETATVHFFRINNVAFDPAAPDMSMLTSCSLSVQGSNDSGTVYLDLNNVGSSADASNTIYGLIYDNFQNGSVITVTMSFPLYKPAYQDTFAGFYAYRNKGWWPMNVTSSSLQPGEPNHGGVNPVGSVWLSLVPADTGTMNVRVSRIWGPLTDPVLAIYSTGFSLPTLVPVTYSLDPMPSVTFPVIGDETYRICIAKRLPEDDGGCIIEWEYEGLIPNTDYANRIAISGSSGSVNDINLVGGIPSNGDPELFYYDGAYKPAWYEWTCPEDGVYKFSVTANGGVAHKSYCRVHMEDPEAPVSGRVTPNLRTVAGQEGSGSFYYSAVSRETRLNGFAGITYYVVVYGYWPDVNDAGQNPYDLTWIQEGIANDYYDAGGSYTAGGYAEIDFGQLATRGVNTPTASLECQPTWVSFYMKYGTTNHFEGGPSTTDGGAVTFFQLLKSNGAVFTSGVLDSWNYTHEMNDVPYFQNEQTMGFNRLTSSSEQYVSILFAREFCHVWIDGTYCGDCGGNNDNEASAKIRVGCITDSSPAYPKTINIRDVKLVSAGFYNRPTQDGGVYSGWTAVEGFENKLSASDWRGRFAGASFAPVNSNDVVLDANAVLGDTPGRGRGVYADAQGTSGSQIGLPATTSSFLTRRIGWCLYLTDSPTQQITYLASFQGYPGIATNLIMYGADTACPGQLALIGNFDTAWADVKLDTGRWHHIELAFCPQQVGTSPPHIDWWINGVQQPRRNYSDFFVAGEQQLIATQYIGIWRQVGVGVGTKGWITDITSGSYDEDGVALGLVKTELLVPNGSGTHSVDANGGYGEDLDAATWPSGGGNWALSDAWMLSTDGGTTHSQIFPTTAVHQVLDEWPPNWYGGGSEDLVAEMSFSSGGNTDWHTRPGDYIEVLMEDPTGTEIVAVSPVLAYRGFFKNVQYSGAGNLIYQAYDLAQSTQPSCFTLKLVNSDGENNMFFLFDWGNAGAQWSKLNSIIKGPGGVAWTPSTISDLKVRWGWKGGYYGGIAGFPLYPVPEYISNYQGYGQGSCLEAVALEVASTDTMFAPAPAGYGPPTITVASWYGYDSSAIDGTSKNSCDAWAPRGFPATDPFMQGVVWFDPYYSVNANPDGSRNDWRMYFRVTPPQDPNIPGLDGDFHDTPEDLAAGTTSWHSLSDWIYYSGELYGGESQGSLSWYPTSDQLVEYNELEVWYYTGNGMYADWPQFESFRWYFDACHNGRLGTFDPDDGSVTLEVYARTLDGVAGPITTVTWSVLRGLCCGALPQIYRRLPRR